MVLSIPSYFCLIGLVALFCQITALRMKLPAILFLLSAGLILGPVTGILKPDALFGDLLFPVASLAVSIILFEGSLGLNFADIAHKSKTLIVLITVGPVITWLGIAAAAYYTHLFSGPAALLFGAILIVSGPTVIKPILSAIKPNNNIANLLYWDGIILDPLGALITSVLAGYFISHPDGSFINEVFFEFLAVILMAIAFGVVNGVLLNEFLKRHLFSNAMENIVILNWVITAFVIANHFAEETGLVVVTTMGVFIANCKKINIESLLDFKETLSTLLISALFIVLAARVEISSLRDVVPESLLIFACMTFIIQPLKIFLTTLGSRLNWREKFMLSWISPKGIVAAALVSILAVRLDGIGHIDDKLLIPIVFLIIVYSVALPSLTAGFLTRWLGVALPKENGVLILGANRLAREIAIVLMKKNIPVLVADSSWEAISNARLSKIPTYFGNITSDNADRTLDLTGMGKLFTITPNIELGTLARLRYAHVFGKNSIYYVATEAEKNTSERHLISEKNRGKRLFPAATFEHLTEILENGGELRVTGLSDNFTFEKYLEKNDDYCLILFYINKNQEVVPWARGQSIPSEVSVVSLFFSKQSETTSNQSC